MSEYRDLCFAEKGRECIICGATEDIVVHHIDGDRSNNSLSNLMPVCWSCHFSIHSGAEGYEEYTEKLPPSARGGGGDTTVEGEVLFSLSGGSMAIEYEQETSTGNRIWFEEDFDVESIEWEEFDGKTKLTIISESPIG